MIVCALTFAIWAYQLDRTRQSNWRSPLDFAGDGLLLAAAITAAAEGDTPFLGSKAPRRLGAPFGADWNGWPATEELLVTLGGWLTQQLGVAPAAAALLALGHVLAAAAFFFAARQLGVARLWAGAFALLFAISRYIFGRGLGHITVAHCWHVPLCWLVIHYAWSRGGLLKTRRRMVIALVVSIVTALQSPYFTFVYVQFLLIAALIRALRQRSIVAAAPALGACAVVVVFFAMMHLDTWRYRRVDPQAGATFVRRYTDMELYAMKPIDLVFPVNWRIPFVQQRLAEYQQGRVTPGEHPLSYMGAIAAIGLLLLAAVAFRDVAVARRLSPATLKHALPTAWLIALSVAAGPLALAALITNSYVLRSSNRFSIFVICAVYFFLAESARRLFRSAPRPLAAVAAGAIPLLGFADLPPRRPHFVTVAERLQWKKLQKFVSQVENLTGRDAMIFVLPALEFPEAPPRLHEGQYTPLALYVARSSLRFSYGNLKGDPRDRWQTAVEAMPPADMAAKLREYGFSGVVLFRAAYADGGAAIINAFAQAGYPVGAKRGDIVFISLPHPQNPPALPPRT